MSLATSKKSFVEDASRLKDYDKMSVLELANLACDAEEQGNEKLRSSCWSALMLHYWYKIHKWKMSSMSLGLEDDEFVFWLYDSLCAAFHYRSWRWEYKAVVKKGKFIEWKLDENGEKIPNPHYWKVDPNAADRTINFFCAAQRGRVYQYMNKDERKLNAQATSIESIVDDNGRQIDSIGHTKPLEVSGAKELVNLLLKNKKPMEALVADGIAYQDSFRTKKQTSHFKDLDSQGNEVNKRVITKSESFDMRMLVKHLSTIDSEFIKNYFCSTYYLSQDEGNSILEQVSKMSNPKWYNCIKKTMLEIKDNPNLLSCLLNH